MSNATKKSLWFVEWLSTERVYIVTDDVKGEATKPTVTEVRNAVADQIQAAVGGKPVVTVSPRAWSATDTYAEDGWDYGCTPCGGHTSLRTMAKEQLELEKEEHSTVIVGGKKYKLVPVEED